jgi:hypothetical protein
MTSNRIGKPALVWRGDAKTVVERSPENNRWHQIFAALARRTSMQAGRLCEDRPDERHEQ